MVDYWNKFSDSSSTAVLEPNEAEATDNGLQGRNEDHDSNGTIARGLPPDGGRSVGSAWGQEQIADNPTESSVPGSPESNAPARPGFSAEYSSPSESDTGTCDGEIIEVLDSRVVCWLTIGDKLRVRSALDESLFENLPKYPGAEFRWSPDSGAVFPMEFDNDDLVAEFNQLEREWNEDLKHRNPRMAD